MSGLLNDIVQYGNHYSSIMSPLLAPDRTNVRLKLYKCLGAPEREQERGISRAVEPGWSHSGGSCLSHCAWCRCLCVGYGDKTVTGKAGVD